MSAIGAATSLCYCTIALILGCVYAGNRYGSVGGMAGSTADKVFGILNALGSLGFAYSFAQASGKDAALRRCGAAAVVLFSQPSGWSRALPTVGWVGSAMAHEHSSATQLLAEDYRCVYINSAACCACRCLLCLLWLPTALRCRCCWRFRTR